MSRPDWLLDAPMFTRNSKADTPLFNFLVRLMRGEHLQFKEAADFFRALTDDYANPAQIAGCLVAMTTKGETFEELAGMARVMQEKAKPITSSYKDYIDVAGTGSSPIKTFNVSTAAAFVIAGAGLAVAKHTARGITTKTGSADLLEKLNVNTKADVSAIQASLNGAGISFLLAPKLHKYLLPVADIRSKLGVRTSLILLAALSNPSKAPFQLLGVWHPSLVQPMAQAIALLGTKKAWVVHGSDGLDELTLNGKTFVTEVVGKKIRQFEITPQEFGLQQSDLKNVLAKNPEESAQIVNDVLESKRRDEARSLVVLNAAAALLIGGLCKDPMQAARKAEQSIDSGAAKIKLDRVIQATNKK